MINKEIEGIYSTDPIDWTHPIDNIEPEELEESERGEAIAELMRFIFKSNHASNKVYVVNSIRRFICLTYLVKPELLRGMSQIEIGEALRCTSANISHIAHNLANETGIRGSLESEESSEAHRVAQRAKAKAQNAKVKHKKSIKDACDRARDKLNSSDGISLDRFEVKAMMKSKLMNADELLTNKGINFINDSDK